MRKITIPPNVVVRAFNRQTHQLEEVEMSFIQYLIDNPLSDSSFGVSLEMLEKSEELIKFLQGVKVGEKIELADYLWRMIDELVNAPKTPYDPTVARQLLPFFRAIRQATDTTNDLKQEGEK